MNEKSEKALQHAIMLHNYYSDQYQANKTKFNEGRLEGVSETLRNLQNGGMVNFNFDNNKWQIIPQKMCIDITSTDIEKQQKITKLKSKLKEIIELLDSNIINAYNPDYNKIYRNGVLDSLACLGEAGLVGYIRDENKWIIKSDIEKVW